MAKLEFFGDMCILRLGSNLKTLFLKDAEMSSKIKANSGC